MLCWPNSQVKINAVPKSEYVVRTQPTKESLCTLESVTYALMHFENNPSLREVLLRPLRMLCQFQLSHGSAVQYSKDDVRYIHRTERKKMMKEEEEEKKEVDEEEKEEKKGEVQEEEEVDEQMEEEGV